MQVLVVNTGAYLDIFFSRREEKPSKKVVKLFLNVRDKGHTLSVWPLICWMARKNDVSEIDVEFRSTVFTTFLKTSGILKLGTGAPSRPNHRLSSITGTGSPSPVTR